MGTQRGTEKFVYQGDNAKRVAYEIAVAHLGRDYTRCEEGRKWESVEGFDGGGAGFYTFSAPWA